MRSSRTFGIRRATRADVPAIARVHVASWRTTYRGLLPDDHLAALRVEEREAMWRDILAGGASTVLVAQDDGGAVVGFASGGPSRWAGLPFDGELYAIYLLHERQRRGIGGALVRELARALHAAGLRSMLAWVVARNPACAFYERLGAQRAGVRHEDVAGVYLEERAYAWPSLEPLLGAPAGGRGGGR